jgi:xylulokinase
VQTLIHRQFTGSRVVDPSHASFMGLYNVPKLSGWSEPICNLVGASEHQLPQLIESNAVAGLITRPAGRLFGLTHGTPMLCGCIDTSAAMFLAGCRPGTLLNVSGSTDVLALCTDRPKPHEQLLTRALGVGRRWMSVSTLAAAGSALSWARDQLFADLAPADFFKLVGELAREPKPDTGGVTFEPYLAGSRTSIEQPRGAFTGLTLSTTRRQMLTAVIEALAAASAQRVDLLRGANPRLKISRHVILSGGAHAALHDLLHRDWPGKWNYQTEDEATLRGLASLAEG